MKRIAVLLYILILSISTISGQKKQSSAKRTGHEIRFITLEFRHSLRIPNHHITIEIVNRKEPAMIVKSEAMNDDEQWQSYNRDTTLAINKEQFETLKLKANKLKEIDLEKANLFGKDGTTCALKIGYFNSVTYEFWTPDWATKKRGLEDFLSLFKDILELAGFDPKEIL
jgi:hypothetical protein